MKYTIFWFSLLFPGLIFTQSSFFQKINTLDFTPAASSREIFPNSYTLLDFKALQFQAFIEKSLASDSAIIVKLPLTGGEHITFRVKEAPILAASLRSEFPDHLDYAGWSTEGSKRYLRFGWNGTHFYAIILGADHTIYIDPLDKNSRKKYLCYSKKAYATNYLQEYQNFFYALEQSNPELPMISFRTSGDQIRTYRLAVSATENYTSAIGTQAEAFEKLKNTVARVTAIFERELAVSFSLVSTTNLVFTTDGIPFTAEGTGALSDLVEENQTIIDGIIGAANYDIGHVLDVSPTDATEGYAFHASLCDTDDKAKAASRGPSNPEDDPFDVDLVCRQFGHQFGANNTHNSDLTTDCSTERNAATAYEPGSGTTIMSTIACGADNIQDFNDDYFHAGTYKEIIDFIQSSAIATCPTVTSSGNTIPSVDANPDNGNYTIPKSTPFELTGEASDIDDDDLTYCWEGLNLGSAGSPSASSAPYFRSFPPVSNPTRSFPNIAAILDGTNTGQAEFLPNSSTSLAFNLTVRDNNSNSGGRNNATISIDVDGNSGPFEVTSQLAVISYTANGSNTFSVTWQVAGTTDSPVNCSDVDILLSTDGGQTFPYTLAAATPNDGLEILTIPAFPTTNGRIKVKCSDNVFFDINNAVISIFSACEAEGASFSPEEAILAAPGSSDLDLNLNTEWGSAITNFLGSITSSDLTFRLAGKVLDGFGCTTVSNLPYADTYEFQVDAAGTYTFNTSFFGAVLNLYEFAFDPSNSCANWLASSGDIDENGIYATNPFMTATLDKRKTYVLVLSGFGTGETLSYTNTYSGPGILYDGPVNPGGDFKYIYAIIDNTNNKIIALQDDPDLTDPNAFPPGDYTVQGISYLNTDNINDYNGEDFSSLLLAIASTDICASLSSNTKAISIAALLPVELKSFYGEAVKEEAHLFWETITEQHNDYFLLERSNDGINFEAITTIQGKGFSTQASIYTYIDKTPFSGTNYYRLSQIDFDGSRQIYGIIAIDFLNILDNWYITALPIQAGKLPITLITASAGTYQFELFSATGTILGTQRVSSFKGEHSYTLSFPNLQSGIYFLRVKQNRSSKTLKVLNY